MVVVRDKAGEVAVGKAGEVVVKEKGWKFEIVVSSFQTPNHMTYLSSFFFFFALSANYCPPYSYQPQLR